MKQKEIVGLSVEDLKAKIKEERSVLDKLKFSHALSPIENPSVIRQTKKNIARLNTELSHKSK